MEAGFFLLQFPGRFEGFPYIVLWNQQNNVIQFFYIDRDAIYENYDKIIMMLLFGYCWSGILSEGT